MNEFSVLFSMLNQFAIQIKCRKVCTFWQLWHESDELHANLEFTIRQIIARVTQRMVASEGLPSSSWFSHRSVSSHGLIMAIGATVFRHNRRTKRAKNRSNFFRVSCLSAFGVLWMWKVVLLSVRCGSGLRRCEPIHRNCISASLSTALKPHSHRLKQSLVLQVWAHNVFAITQYFSLTFRPNKPSLFAVLIASIPRILFGAKTHFVRRFISYLRAKSVISWEGLHFRSHLFFVASVRVEWPRLRAAIAKLSPSIGFHVTPTSHCFGKLVDWIFVESFSGRSDWKSGIDSWHRWFGGHWIPFGSAGQRSAQALCLIFGSIRI